MPADFRLMGPAGKGITLQGTDNMHDKTLGQESRI